MRSQARTVRARSEAGSDLLVTTLIVACSNRSTITADETARITPALGYVLTAIAICRHAIGKQWNIRTCTFTANDGTKPAV